MTIFKFVFLAMLFVGTGGAFLTKWWRKHPTLAILTATLLLVGTFHTIRDLYRDLNNGWIRETPEAPTYTKNKDAPNQSNAVPEASPPATSSKELLKLKGRIDKPEKTPPAPEDRGESGSGRQSASVNPAPPNTTSTRLLADVLDIQVFPHPEGLNHEFPAVYLRDQLRDELPTVRTSLSRLQVNATFVEPKSERAQIYGGDVRGYFLVAVADIPNCAKAFGPARTYQATSTRLGLRRAINMQASTIAAWLAAALEKGRLVCPG